MTKMIARVTTKRTDAVRCATLIHTSRDGVRFRGMRNGRTGNFTFDSEAAAIAACRRNFSETNNIEFVFAD